tara:strand:- start:150 stop:395 length:246 start_codon:yes stop_codon:yes gene_type:complete
LDVSAKLGFAPSGEWFPGRTLAQSDMWSDGLASGVLCFHTTGVDTHSHTLWSHAALIVMPGSLLFSSGLMFVGWFVLALIG